MKSLHPHDSGEKILVEMCQRIEITDYTRRATASLKRTLIESELKLNDKVIALISSQTAFGGIRYWFECPIGKERVAVLFVHPVTGEIGCRECLNLEYQSRRYKGMSEKH